MTTRKRKSPASPEEAHEETSEQMPVDRRTMQKTPMFAASHAGRYHRQALIKEIQILQGSKADLLCYVSGSEQQIERDDTLGFVDLLINVPSGANIDLLLHTVGGDIDAAQKLVDLVLKRIGDTGRLRVVIPDYAKSAGTLMALGAHEIVMSDSSELGMIDPQYTLKDERGNEILTSVMAYLSAFREHSEAVQRNRDDAVAAAMLSQFDPIVVRKFQGYRDRTQDIAMRMLNRRGADSTRISAALINIEMWKSHGQMIGHEDAKGLGLNINYLSPNDAVWQKYWQLYCLQRLEVGKDKKIFESAFVSQTFEN